jgi:hypothetical protein
MGLLVSDGPFRAVEGRWRIQAGWVVLLSSWARLSIRRVGR